MLDPQTEITLLRRKCIGCGKCRRACPIADEGYMDPMDIMLIGEGDLSLCTECGACSEACRRSDPFKVIMNLKKLEGIN